VSAGCAPYGAKTKALAARAAQQKGVKHHANTCFPDLRVYLFPVGCSVDNATNNTTNTHQFHRTWSSVLYAVSVTANSSLKGGKTCC
jgi:hypothetical protein